MTILSTVSSFKGIRILKLDYSISGLLNSTDDTSTYNTHDMNTISRTSYHVGTVSYSYSSVHGKSDYDSYMLGSFERDAKSSISKMAEFEEQEKRAKREIVQRVTNDLLSYPIGVFATERAIPFLVDLNDDTESNKFQCSIEAKLFLFLTEYEINLWNEICVEQRLCNETTRDYTPIQ